MDWIIQQGASYKILSWGEWVEYEWKWNRRGCVFYFCYKSYSHAVKHSQPSSNGGTTLDVHQMNLSLVCAAPEGFISDKWPPTNSCVTQVREEYIYTLMAPQMMVVCVVVCVGVFVCLVRETDVKRLSLWKACDVGSLWWSVHFVVTWLIAGCALVACGHSNMKLH